MVKYLRARAFSVLAAMLLSLLAPMNFAQAAINLGDTDNKKTVTLKVNTGVTIALDSTFWLDATSTNLKITKPKAVKAIPFGPAAPEGCQHPGTGCGTSTWVFKATRKGKASFTVTRDSCGEALRCTPDQSTYTVRFIVK